MHLDHRGGEEAAAGEDPPFQVVEESIHERDDRRSAGSGLERRMDHLPVERHPGRLDDGELERLLGAEVGIQPALAHAEVIGEAADGQAIESLDSRQGRRGRQDLGPGPLAVGARPSGFGERGRHLSISVTSACRW